MKCPSCQFDNPSSAKFCNECGKLLIALADGSASPVPPQLNAHRLQQYASQTPTGEILPKMERTDGELRYVTIMFCDMKGFTPLAAKIGPERTFSLMDQIFEIIIHRVNKYEGMVNELRGDGALVFFGAPVATEEAAIKSLHCALEIQKEIARFNEMISGQEDIPPILFRIGINSGPAVVGFMGKDLRAQYTAQGDTVNVAARMEAIADPGSIYVTEETYRITKLMFHFEELGNIRVKGKKRPLPVYRLLSPKTDAYRPRLGGERGLYSEMVGRDEELARLEFQVTKAINGRGAIVNVIGEAGIGKSRLMAELKKRDVMKSITFLEGRATSIGRKLSFHPIIDLLKNWARIDTSDSGTEAFAKLEAAVRRISPDQTDEVLPFLATVMGMRLSGRYAERVKGIEGEALDKLILKNIRDFLASASDFRPLVLVAEDLHWADASSIDMIESLFRLVESHPILFVNVFRPGTEETGDRISATARELFPDHYVEIVLQPLDKRMSQTLISNMLKVGGIQHAFLAETVERSGGNPFFIEEVVRSLVEEGAIAVEDGTLKVTDRIHHMVVPRTINDVLMARMDHLEEKTRNLLKTASVIGRNFYYRILSEVADDVDEIDARLAYLKDVQILRERKKKGEVEYFFKHVLAQEAAYHAILPHKKQELHLKVANSIETLFAENLHEFYGMLAFHYSKAQAPQKAEDYLLRAGEEALKSSASHEAIHYYQDALALYLKQKGLSYDPEKLAMIEKNIALALYNKGLYEEAVRYFDQALDYYWGRLPRNPFSKTCQFVLGFLHFLVSLYVPFLKYRKIPAMNDSLAIELFFKKLKALVILNPKQFFVQSFYFNRRLTEFDLSKIESGPGMLVGGSSFFSFTGISFRLSKKILDFVKEHHVVEDIKSITVYDFCHTMHHYFVGDWELIKDYDEDLVKENLDIGDIYFAAQHLYWHGCPKLYQGDFVLTGVLVKKLSDIFDMYQNELPMLLKFLLNTSLLIECHKLDLALTEIENAIEFGKKLSQGTILIEMNSRKAHVYTLMGNIEEAEKSIQSADKIRRETDTVPWQLSDFFRSRFEIDLHYLEEFSTARIQKSLRMWKRKADNSGRNLLKVTQKVAQYRTDSYRLRGVYYWLINRQKQALKWWRKAIEEGERLGAQIELSRTYLEIGRRLLEPGSQYDELNGVKAESYVEKGRTLFREMDLQWDMDGLDRMNGG
jgi:class 3 adenylate cyclase/tetratricopeptide (TPR) repeat protein